MVACNYHSRDECKCGNKIITINDITIDCVNDDENDFFAFIIRDKGGTIDTFPYLPTEKHHCYAPILVQDFNQDGVYDVLIANNYHNTSGISYYILFSDTNGNLTKPKLKLGDIYVDFLKNKDFIHYNMKYATFRMDKYDNVFMFCHPYSFVQIYGLENGVNFVPLVELSRDSSNFNRISYWDSSNLSWKNPTLILKNKDSTYLNMINTHWNLPFIGE